MSLPKSWAVKNDGSQKFKDTVIKYLNENHNSTYDGICFNSYYGLKNNGDWICNDSSNHYATILTLEEFINLTTPNMTIEEQIKDIEKQLEVLKASLVKPQFEAGKWYYFIHGDISWLFNYKGINYSSVTTNCAISSYSGWNDASDLLTNYEELLKNKSLRPATPSEIQEALKTQWEKLGTLYKVLKTNATGEDGEGAIVLNTGYDYNPDTDELRCNVKHGFYNKRIIYSKGKFATIIKYEVIKIGGETVVFSKGSIAINGVEYSKSELEYLKKITDKGQVKSLNVGCSGQYVFTPITLNLILAKL